MLAAVAGVLAIAAGGLVVVRGRSWPGMGRRYERAGAETPPRTERAERTDEDRAQDAWKALDRGEDPTDGEPARRGRGPYSATGRSRMQPAPRPERSGTGSRVAATHPAGEGTDVRQAENHGDPSS